MNDTFPTALVDATPDDVLAILRDSHRHQCSYDPEADDGIQLTTDTSIAEWRQACDLVGNRRLGRALNQGWLISVSDSDWQAVLEPAREKRLAGVCELIAEHAKLPAVRPARMLGSECLTAGVFLTVRSLLANAGADVPQLAPSTPLEKFTRRYTHIFLHDLSRLAPGVLPRVEIHAPLRSGLLTMFVLSFLASLIFAPFALLALISFLSLTIAAVFKMPPERVQFGTLRTFRELSVAVAAGART